MKTDPAGETDTPQSPSKHAAQEQYL
jgi:hypothetical protein